MRHDGANVSTPAHASPYPVSRLAPAHDLVDTAREIAQADNMLGTVANAKLEVIAEQIRDLQDKARRVLDQAATHAALHRAACSFRRRIGQTYHLYQRGDGQRYFSLLAPDEWRGESPHPFEGSFRLESDMTWSAAAAPPRRETRELRADIGVED
ncbi:MAG: DUF2452 domain-containing protein [Nannocystaceae bacterium]|nr:DUF2452 domain-containing protein [Nannocystaceae bacterium]